MLNSLLKLHNETVLVDGNGFAVDCILKENASHEGYPIKGFSTFVGVTFDESGVRNTNNGYFGDSFQITLNLATVRKFTDKMPVEGWFIIVTFPQMNNAQVEFCVERAPIDRTNGRILLECSASTAQGEGKRVNRNDPGGI